MTGPGRPCTFPSPWLEFVEHHGTVERAAQALCTSPRTLREWATGTRTPTGTAQLGINYCFLMAGIVSPALLYARAGSAMRVGYQKNDTKELRR
jgi:hypothetical protein